MPEVHQKDLSLQGHQKLSCRASPLTPLISINPPVVSSTFVPTKSVHNRVLLDSSQNEICTRNRNRQGRLVCSRRTGSNRFTCCDWLEKVGSLSSSKLELPHLMPVTYIALCTVRLRMDVQIETPNRDASKPKIWCMASARQVSGRWENEVSCMGEYA